MSSSGYVRRKISKGYSPGLLPSIARRHLETIRAKKRSGSTDSPSLCDFVHEISPYLEAPRWLEPYAAVLERAPGGDLRTCVAAPPQHGKTELALRAFIWWDVKAPGLHHAYATYNKSRAIEVAKIFQRLLDEAAVKWGGTLDTVWLPNGSAVKFTSVDSSLTGYALDGVLVIDDPIKDAKEARSAARRRDCVEWYKSVARSRRHPGTSIVCMATRWHVADLSGYLLDNEKFRYVNLKAIAEPLSQDDVDGDGRVISDPLRRRVGQSLWSRKPPEFFEEERTDAYWWASMYQGEPRPLGASVFREPGSLDDEGNPTGPGYYRELPTAGYRGAFGLDLAYTAKAQSDYSVCVEGVEHGGKLYLVDVVRKQVDAPSFGLTLKTMCSRRPGWPMRWYIGGTEKAAVDFFKRQGIQIKAIPAVADKLVRATPAAAAWNRGDVLLPDPEYIKAPWLSEFLGVVLGFTGQGDAHDDDVDALAALHDQLMKRSKMLDALRRAGV